MSLKRLLLIDANDYKSRKKHLHDKGRYKIKQGIKTRIIQKIVSHLFEI